MNLTRRTTNNCIHKDRETEGQIGSGAIMGPLVWALKKQLWIETNIVKNITDLVCDRQRKSKILMAHKITFQSKESGINL